MTPMLAHHPPHPRQHATHPSMPPTLARHPRKHATHATHASTSPTQARDPHHPRQHEEHPISQTPCRLITKLLYEQQYSKTQSYETERNIFIIRFLVTISNLQLRQIKIQEDHNILTRILYFVQLLQLWKIRENPCLLLVTYRNQVFFIFYFIKLEIH